MSKSIALLVALGLIFGILGLDLLFPERVKAEAYLTAVVTLVSAYIALQVADSGVKGKCWNQAMFDSLNEDENSNQVPDLIEKYIEKRIKEERNG